MNVRINGKEQELAEGSSLADLVNVHIPNSRWIAVVVNGEVVPRSTWVARQITAGDTVEVLAPRQGG